MGRFPASVWPSKPWKKHQPRSLKKEWRPLNLLKSPMTPASPTPLSSMLPQCTEHEALMIRPEGEINKTVFYFPGCGSERLYGDIAMASIYLLLKNNIRVILPPPYLCCGFPAKVNAKKKMAGQISLRDTIILSQIREMLGHLSFDAFLISCGTCRESLHEMGCAEIFECRIDDVSQFVLENALANTWPKEWNRYSTIPRVMTPLTVRVPLLGDFIQTVTSVANCCSEAGTLAISRPDISYAMLERKRESIAES